MWVNGNVTKFLESLVVELVPLVSYTRFALPSENKGRNEPEDGSIPALYSGEFVLPTVVDLNESTRKPDLNLNVPSLGSSTCKAFASVSSNDKAV